MGRRLVDHFEDNVPLYLTIGVAILVAFVIIASIHDDGEWTKFRDSHRCKVVGHTKGGSGYSSRGSYVWMNDQTTWLCDDGLTYTRDSD